MKGRNLDNEHKQENAIKHGVELEISLLGKSHALKGDLSSPISRNKDFDKVLSEVRTDLLRKERLADNAEVDNDYFSDYETMSIQPDTEYTKALYTQLCKLLEFKDVDSGKLRYYNTLGSELDYRFGSDFVIEIDPSLLPVNLFGEEVRRLKHPVFVTCDIKMNPENRSSADIALIHEKAAENENDDDADKNKNKNAEVIEWGKKDAGKIFFKGILRSLRREFKNVIYSPPIEQIEDEIAADIFGVANDVKKKVEKAAPKSKRRRIIKPKAA